MHCHLVLAPESRGWVIEKMCRRLGAELEKLGHRVTIGDVANAAANINHFTLFWWLPLQLPHPSTVAITHIDDSHRLSLASNTLSKATMAICMSSMTVRLLVSSGLPREKISYVLPAIDAGPEPRRITIGIATKVYPDGRKREVLLMRLAKEIDLSAFHFEIFGTGWERVVDTLRESGATVSLTVGTDDVASDYLQLRKQMLYFDYYLYLGLDEGALSTLDALASGVKTIVTPQGFHVDLPDGITHPIWTYRDLRSVFEALRDDREARIQSVRGLTWAAYAERHAFIWQAILDGRVAELPRLLGQESLEPLGCATANQDRLMQSEQRRLWLRSLMRYRIPRWHAAGSSRLREILTTAFVRHLFRY